MKESNIQCENEICMYYDKKYDEYCSAPLEYSINCSCKYSKNKILKGCND